MSLEVIRQRRYATLVAFDRDMSSLFERGRRYHPEGSIEYGQVIVLQRLYNALTAPFPMPLPANGIPAPSATMFASLPAGPGTARPVHEITQDLKAGMAEGDVGIGITTFRVGNKDRVFTDEARHKGIAYKTGTPYSLIWLIIGDYIHLINPDDASRPIVGQIFRTFVPTKGYKTHHVTVCWYFRPEQVSIHLGCKAIADNRSSTVPRDDFMKGRYSKLVISVITPSRILLSVSDANSMSERFEVDQELRNGTPAGPFVSDEVLIGSFD
jgi:hypothetical protein